MKIQVIIGSVRPNSVSSKTAKWIYGILKKKSEIEVELLDLNDYQLPFYDEKGSPRSLKGEYISEIGRKWLEKIKEGDGYIMVTPEYNHGPSAVLKNAIDWVGFEWNKKPVGFISHGTVGGARAVEQLRQVVIELEMVPLKSSIHIAEPWNLIDEEGELKTEGFESQAEKFIDDIIFWTDALHKIRGVK